MDEMEVTLRFPIVQEVIKLLHNLVIQSRENLSQFTISKNDFL